MKKTLMLIVLAMISVSLLYAQGVKDPQEELKKMQQSIKAVQNATAQLKHQTNELKKTTAALEESLKNIQMTQPGRDSLLNATRDSLGIVAAQSKEAVEIVSKARTMMTFSQVVIILCLVLIIIVLFLLLKLKKESRKMREKMESNRDRLDNRITQLAGSLEENVKRLQEDGLHRNQVVEKRITDLKEAIYTEISANKRHSETVMAELSVKAEHATAELKNSVEARLTEVSQQSADLDGKTRTALGALKSEFQHAISEVKTAIDKVSSSVQSIAKHPKHSGNSAE